MRITPKSPQELFGLTGPGTYRYKVLEHKNIKSDDGSEREILTFQYWVDGFEKRITATFRENCTPFWEKVIYTFCKANGFMTNYNSGTFPSPTETIGKEGEFKIIATEGKAGKDGKYYEPSNMIVGFICDCTNFPDVENTDKQQPAEQQIPSAKKPMNFATYNQQEEPPF